VADAAFDTQDDADPGLRGEAQRAFWAQIIRYGGYVLLGLVFCLFVARPLVQWLTGTGRSTETVVETVLPRTVQELEAGMRAPEMLPEGEEAVLAQIEASAQPARPTGASLRARVIEQAKKDPEHTAEILRMWLKRG
jgi:flagellar biosynthesis/type III secretory pathway M-ring protein FliF/YscJ